MGVEGNSAQIADTLKNGATIVDARSAKAYEKDHIEGRRIRATRRTPELLGCEEPPVLGLIG